MPMLQSIYNRLPPVMRHVAASARGWQLAWWRYGPQAEALVAEALARDSWSAEQWKTYQENRLGYILHRAATQVPYYRDYWAQRRRQGDSASWEMLENWPVLTKGELRANPTAFLAEDCTAGQMRHIYTSGTTGTPLDIWRSRRTETELYALIEARGRRWHGVSRHEAWAILGGQQVVPPGVSSPPFWVWNQTGNQLYLAANHISLKNAAAYTDALKRYGITHIIAYASSIAFLAQQFLEIGAQFDGQIRLVQTNSEPLYDWQRSVIQEGLGCPVRQIYGLGETVAEASEDPAGRLRLWPEVGLIEILDDNTDETLPEGQSGRLIGTGLLNPDMILIRYDTGDRSSLSVERPASDDPLQLPLMSGIEGRKSDMLITSDGRRVYWVNPVFYGLPVVEAQIVQESLEQVRIVYVPGSGFSDDLRQTLRERLQREIGPVQVDLEQVERVPRGPNGKFRPVISRVDTAAVSQGESAERE